MILVLSEEFVKTGLRLFTTHHHPRLALQRQTCYTFDFHLHNYQGRSLPVGVCLQDKFEGLELTSKDSVLCCDSMGLHPTFHVLSAVYGPLQPAPSGRAPERALFVTCRVDPDFGRSLLEGLPLVLTAKEVRYNDTIT